MVRSGKNGGLHLKQIAYYKRTGEYHPTTLPSERSGIRRAAKKFEFKEKKLFYIGKDKKQNRLVIISEEEKDKVLRECHEGSTGAHHGISRTLTLVESGYYWTSVTNDVKQWVYSCQHCQVAKSSTVLARRYQPLKVEEPWSVVTVDLMGPFHSSSQSHMYALIMTDLFTKWIVILPLHDVSASEISKAIISIFFLYGPPQKIVMDQGDEFIHQINGELFGLFGVKQMVSFYPSQPEEANERTANTIKIFLSKYCLDHPNDWDDHLLAISYAFNLTYLEPSKNTPYFQMFNRNPDELGASDVFHEGEGSENICMFAKILRAVKEADKIMVDKTTSTCQLDNHIHDDAPSKSKIIIKRRPKQLNPFRLKVGHEVLRQRKNWWKDGRFHSEWVGPCVIDYITEKGCAVLRDNTGTRLKRPIKMSHLKPYVRDSGEQGCAYSVEAMDSMEKIGETKIKVFVGFCVSENAIKSWLPPRRSPLCLMDGHYHLHDSVVADHDYIGLAEIPIGSYQPETLVEDTAVCEADDKLPVPSQDHELSESRNSKMSQLLEDHGIQPINLNLEKQAFSLLDSSNQDLDYLS